MLMIALNAVGRTLLGRGLTFGGNALATRTAGALIGPVGWVLAAASLVPVFTGPAYRVTIPGVLNVALMRKEQSADVVGEPSKAPKSDVPKPAARKARRKRPNKTTARRSDTPRPTERRRKGGRREK